MKKTKKTKQYGKFTLTFTEEEMDALYYAVHNFFGPLAVKGNLSEKGMNDYRKLTSRLHYKV